MAIRIVIHHEIGIPKQTKDYIHTYDNEDGRYISYRITPYTVNSLSRHIYLGKSMQKKYMRKLKKLTAGELPNLRAGKPTNLFVG